MPPALWSLQAGRAIAALAVVVHHASLAARDFAGALPHQAVWEAGYLGVDFFFVLSGFIIAYSTIDRNRTPFEYARARFVRVYLPYWPIGIAVALLYIAMPAVSAGDHVWQWFPTLTLAPVTSSTALSVAWTLKHEIFYAIFGLAYFTRTWRWLLPAWAAAIVIWNIAGFAPKVPLALINLEFLAGILVAHYFKRASWWWLPIAACLMVGWVAIGHSRDQSVLVGAGIAALLMVVARRDWEGRLRTPPILKLLGNSSYSIYLVHGLAISIVARLLPPNNLLVLVGAAIVGTMAGLAYHQIVERPALRLSRRREVAAIPIHPFESGAQTKTGEPESSPAS